MKRGQEPEDRARDIEAALDWMRNTGVSLADEDAVDKLNEDGSIPVSRRSPEERSEDVDNAVTWLSNNNNKGDSPSMDPTGDFKKIDQKLPKKKDQKPEERAREIEGVLDWTRSNHVSPDGYLIGKLLPRA